MKVINKITLKDVDHATIRVSEGKHVGQVRLHKSRWDVQTKQYLCRVTETKITIPCFSYGKIGDPVANYDIIVSKQLVKLLKYATDFVVYWDNANTALAEKGMAMQTVTMTLSDSSEISCHEIIDSDLIPNLVAIR